MPHLSTSQLTAERENWFREVEEGLLFHLRSVSVFEADRLREDLGDPGLIAALLVARAWVLLADGKRTDEIAGELAAIPVFANPAPSEHEVVDLVEAVESEFFNSGLARGVCLDGLGLAPWSPESTHMLLTERWAAVRGITTPRPRVERELSELWGLEDPRVLSAFASLPAYPLEGYPDIWKTLKNASEEDTRVGNLGGVALTERGGNRPAQRWSESRPWSLAKITHLHSLGVDLARCQGAQRTCASLLRQAPPGDDFVAVIEHTAEIVQHQVERVAVAIEGMSAIEYDLLRERDADEHLQDGCLETFQQQILAPGRLFQDLPEDGCVHGTWGPLPWWSITVQEGRARLAAEGLLLRGGMQILISAESQDSDELIITCGEPGLGPSGIEARFHYDLSDPTHACELLLLGRRGKVPVDFVSVTYDEWDDSSVELLGTLGLTVGEEPSAMLVDMATRALRRQLPGASGPDYYADGVPELERVLKSARPPAAVRASQRTDRETQEHEL
jgi:hypothetical protein